MGINEELKKKNCKKIIDNYHEIQKLLHNVPVYFVDGGIGHILKTPSLNFVFIRIVSVVFRNNVREKIIKKEYYAVINNKAKVFEIDGRFVCTYDTNDCSKLLKKMEVEFINDNNGIIIRDGSLDGVKTSKNFICGLSKTTSMIVNGQNVVDVLMKNAPFKPWIYKNYETKKDFNVNFVCLHEKSSYCFRLDTPSNDGDIMKLASILRLNSIDPVFLGYPYGLTLADDIARVTNTEVEYLRTKYSKIVEEYRFDENSLNAHEILDRMKFEKYK